MRVGIDGRWNGALYKLGCVGSFLWKNPVSVSHEVGTSPTVLYCEPTPGHAVRQGWVKSVDSLYGNIHKQTINTQGTFSTDGRLILVAVG